MVLSCEEENCNQGIEGAGGIEELVIVALKLMHTLARNALLSVRAILSSR